MQGQNGPPVPNPRLPISPLQILKLEPGFAVTVRVLTQIREFVPGLFTHWARRSVYCRGENCPPNFHKLDLVWKGYLYVEAYNQKSNRWNPYCLEVSENLELDFRDLVQRGQVWEISREVTGKGKKAPWRGVLLEERPPDSFPSPIDLVPHLVGVYHTPHVVLNKKNPMPQRILVQPSEAPPPANIAAEMEAQARPELPADRPKLLDLMRERETARKNGHIKKGPEHPA